MTFVHGFNVKDNGARTVDRLEPWARAAGYLPDTDTADYGYYNLLAIRWFHRTQRRNMLARLSKAFTAADVIVTHSNGANFANQALDLLSSQWDRSKILVHISPALDCDADIPSAVKAQLVLSTPHDKAVRLSRFLWCHPWGPMGALGYTGADYRGDTKFDGRVKGHSDWFLDEHSWQTFQYVHEFVQEQRR